MRTRFRITQASLPWLLIAPPLLLVSVFYLYPLAQVLFISVTEPAPGLQNFALLGTSASIQHMLVTTVRVCATTTAVAVLLGYVVSYAMTFSSPRARNLTMVLVVIPMWVSALVRAFAWVALLQRQGLVNSLLMASGVTERPLSLVWNELGVVIGMVHYMLPYAVLPLFSSMRDIDGRCITAARGLGASRWQTFWRIFLPLSLPGVIGAAVLVFVYSLGFFVVPAILGGGKTVMVAEYVRLQIVELLNWGQGTMLAVSLLVSVTATLGVAIRLLGAKRFFGHGGGAA
ncbi:ABC transporter permease [Trinickia mobilis]|uniref:ABC transporter permease n=1 Tax=Trinickia mobilis TaxID=2816356 RepID=UPI001A8CC496|nr:ABC transporter permease [Trinickia mobilis]